jgi:hypothetical protein
MNRKRRKAEARALKDWFGLDRIPDARESTLRVLNERAKAEYEYEKYANW